MPLPNQQKIIGIVGGMGPMSGVLLQKLIIDFTKADTDQKHLPVITFTNPLIPDRTKSLLGPHCGHNFIITIQETANILVQAGATVIGIPCNTAHAKYSEIQQGLSVPIINMVAETVRELERAKIEQVGLLATDGTIQTAVYNRASRNIKWIVPNKQDQEDVMRTIYEIKAGVPLNKKLIFSVCENLISKGATRIVVGCTEISLFYEIISTYFPIVDSLRILAQSLVDYAKTTPGQTVFCPQIAENTLSTN